MDLKLVAERAVEADERGDKVAAVKNYRKAAELLSQLLERERTPRTIETYTQFRQNYLERAAVLEATIGSETPTRDSQNIQMVMQVTGRSEQDCMEALQREGTMEGAVNSLLDNIPVPSPPQPEQSSLSPNHSTSTSSVLSPPTKIPPEDSPPLSSPVNSVIIEPEDNKDQSGPGLRIWPFNGWGRGSAVRSPPPLSTRSGQKTPLSVTEEHRRTIPTHDALALEGVAREPVVSPSSLLSLPRAPWHPDEASASGLSESQRLQQVLDSARVSQLGFCSCSTFVPDCQTPVSLTETHSGEIAPSTTCWRCRYLAALTNTPVDNLCQPEPLVLSHGYITDEEELRIILSKALVSDSVVCGCDLFTSDKKKCLRPASLCFSTDHDVPVTGFCWMCKCMEAQFCDGP